jgi:hypothetical protein
VGEELLHNVSVAQAYRYLEEEKRYCATGHPLAITAPIDLVQLINEAKNDAERKGAEVLALVPTEEPLGRPFKFQPAWYDELKSRANEFNKLLGFGPSVLRALATQVQVEQLGIEVDAAWVPSDEWCYWFLHRQMNLTPRRITSHAVLPAQMEQQARLHGITLSRLAIMISEGLQLKHLSGSDEFACHFFSQNNFKWELKGAKQVPNLLKEDKRQITGDFAHNANGRIIAVHLIFDGTTERSLPSINIRKQQRYNRVLFSRTVNHWANHVSNAVPYRPSSTPRFSHTFTSLYSRSGNQVRFHQQDLRLAPLRDSKGPGHF